MTTQTESRQIWVGEFASQTARPSNKLAYFCVNKLQNGVIGIKNSSANSAEISLSSSGIRTTSGDKTSTAEVNAATDSRSFGRGTDAAPAPSFIYQK